MREYEDIKAIIPDTSILIQKNLLEILEEKDFINPEIIIPEAAIAELEHQANNNEDKGFKGLEYLKYLQSLVDKQYLNLHIEGRRPTTNEIKYADKGEIDSIIRNLAKDENGILITSDNVQAETAKASGIETIYYKQEQENTELKIMKYFTEDTMSIHLKENVEVYAKKGKPGNINLEKITKKPLKYKQIEEYIKDILDKTKSDKKTYLEADFEGATVIQSKDLRININKPPFSESIEITAVRPVAEVSLDYYNISNDLLEDISTGDHGILISGSPGAGKSTFAQALATYFSKELNKIVKTMESPRDLQLPNEITQYSPLEGEMEKTADILLLVRPDITIYDEVRKTQDFQIFADMRLAGVGMVGIVHATKPIDGIQRIANRVELGIIPSIVDTTIFIDEGEIKNIYKTKMTVKVPTGMKEQDLARPVIEVTDYLTGNLMNEIYTYGEQTVVMDVANVKENLKTSKTPVEKLAEKEILKEFRKFLPRTEISAEIISEDRVKISIPKKYRPEIVGKGGKRISEIEEKIGIKISLDPIEEDSEEDFKIDIETTKKGVNLRFPKETKGQSFDIISDDKYLFTATVGKGGIIRLRHDLEITKILLEDIREGRNVYAEKRK